MSLYGVSVDLLRENENSVDQKILGKVENSDDKITEVILVLEIFTISYFIFSYRRLLK